VATGDDRAARILERLRGLDLNRLTPLQALNTLAGFVDEARK